MGSYNVCLGEFTHEKLQQIKDGTLDAITGDYFETNGYRCYIEILHWLQSDVIDKKPSIFSGFAKLPIPESLKKLFGLNKKNVRLVGYIPYPPMIECKNTYNSEESEFNKIF